MYKKIKEIIRYVKELFLESKTLSMPREEDYDEFLRMEEERIKNTPREKNMQNPLVPYFKPFSYNATDMKEKIERFEMQGRPFTSENYEKIFNDLISKESFLSKEKAPYLKKMWEDAKFISETLTPLKVIGLSYGLDLTGGSVRDFVLGNHDKIKDLDFMLSIQGITKKTFVQIEHFFTINELKNVEWNYLLKDELKEKDSSVSVNVFGENVKTSSPEDVLKAKLVELCFNRINDKLEIYDHASKRFNVVGRNNYGDDIFRKDRLISVIKTTGKHTNYPVDLLLTDYTKNDFVDDFDFDICKATICFENEFVNKEFPEHYSHLVSRFIARVEFFADVYNKKVTYDVTKRNEWLIDQSFDDHLPRIIAKYPELKVLVIGDNEGHIKYVQTKHLCMELDKELTHKVDKKKNKIAKL